MTTSRRTFLISATAVAAASTMGLAGCSSGNAGGGSGSGSNGKHNAAKTSKIAVGTKADSTGPAPEAPGATKGGTVQVINRGDFTHLDPQRIYYAPNSSLDLMVTRALTGYKIADDGSMTLVGDLATDVGTVSDNGKTWTFTLKDGLKWEDGSAVTSADVKYSIERGFADFTTEGATYAQGWLTGSLTDFRKKYSGPYTGKSLDAVQTPDDKTVVFKLQTARQDFNFTLAMYTYAVASKKHDTKQAYDKKPYSCGPYRITSHVTDKSMELVRNEHWDPKTDPIRNAYPDKFEFEFGPTSLAGTDRFIADAGKDKYAVTIDINVATERVQTVLTDPKFKSRIVQGIGSGTSMWSINTTRITDTEVRKALNIAWPLQQIRQTAGGDSFGDYATTIMSPLVSGYEKFDLYGKLTTPTGDPVKAKAMLKKIGKVGQKIVLAYPQTDTYDKIAVVIQRALEKAGFNCITKPVDQNSMYDIFGKVDNKYDVYWTAWSADWPTGYTVFQPLFDKGTVFDNSPNYAHFTSPAVTKAIAAATAIADQEQAGKAWAALDKQIMEQAPVIPEFYMRRMYLHGSKVGNVQMDPNFDGCMLYKLYVKK
ncbi:ABC transporter substrate-binding protein [Streptomyces sp. NBC_01766]|uniref:ABC transporter substrate-binding protein n=1 Tax=Streptomyces sp. NBC_01766 TaxID=2975936 RepID=UPI002DD9CEAC|nr:ABC transporter substrate-binding protein [Streptomyces sp. NBC_01766]WSC20068.1 ABC transporter substrate-binding protein [Streptomyces sp. NBC_01766]